VQAVLAAADETRAQQELQVLGGVGLGGTARRHQVGHRPLACGQLLEQPQAQRVPEAVSPWFLLFTAFVGLNLFQSAFTRWCPMMAILRRLGVQTDRGPRRYNELLAAIDASCTECRAAMRMIVWNVDRMI
jgi:hypothetical protein